MPPIPFSLRGSLLTGASAVAMSVSTSGARAQTPPNSLPPTPPPTTTVWVEGALSFTGGGSFNVPSFPGLGAPYTSFNPGNGFEGALGFDYQWPNQPWHFIFDFRYGKSGTATASSASSSSSSSRTHTSSLTGYFSSFLQTSTVTKSTANSASSQAYERERHIVADFMVGRDIGVGANRPEFEFGFRIADLRATGQAQGSTQSTTTTNTMQTLYSSLVFGGIKTNTSSSSSSSTSFFARWNSEFFGVGPRVAITGGIPITGSWSFDYGAGIAALFADKSFDLSVWPTPGAFFETKYSHNTFVFNTDGLLGLSYQFAKNYKFSAGVRADFYNAALLTYNPISGGISGTNRIYWGPFVRLTGTF